MTTNTILSAGLAISQILKDDEGVSAITDNIFPIYSDKADCPYIAYRRVALDSERVKAGSPADRASMTVICYAKIYGDSVTLAESVRSALDGYQGQAAGMAIRGITLTDAEEQFVGDAFAQVLTFEIRL